MGHEFSARALSEYVYAADVSKGGVLSQNHLRRNYLRWVENQVSAESFSFDPPRVRQLGTFSVYESRHLGEKLILRVLADQIGRAYRIKQPDRHTLTRQLKTLFGESAFKVVIKMDISKFYESIDRSVLLNRLQADGRISRHAITCLGRYFESISSVLPTGLPRGVSLSAALSELYMLDFDRALKNLPGVYFTSRYVDDILLFTSEPGYSTRAAAEQLLPAPLRLNSTKSRSVQIGCRCYNSCVHTGLCPCRPKCSCSNAKKSGSINYLGYTFDFIAPNKKVDQPLSVAVTVSPAKIDRIKKRIISACKDHIRTPNFLLLRSRLLFLSENHRIHGARNYGKLLAGPYYNYKLVTTPENFRALDDFYRRTLSAAGSEFGLSLSRSLTASQWRQLLRISFLSGFKSGRSRKLLPTEARAIRACWE